MDETYRMLGRAHELDLEREAQKRHLAAALREAKRAHPESPNASATGAGRAFPGWLAAFARRACADCGAGWIERRGVSRWFNEREETSKM